MKKALTIILMLLIIQPTQAQQADTLSMEMKEKYVAKYDKYMAKAERKIYPGVGFTVLGAIFTGAGINALNTPIYSPVSRTSSTPKSAPSILGFGLLCAVSGFALIFTGIDQRNKAKALLTSNGIAIPIKHKEPHIKSNIQQNKEKYVDGKKLVSDYEHYPGHKTMSYVSIGAGSVFLAFGGNTLYKAIFENYQNIAGGGAHPSYYMRDKTANAWGVIVGGITLLIGAEFAYVGLHHLHKVHMIDNGIAIPIPPKQKFNRRTTYNR